LCAAGKWDCARWPCQKEDPGIHAAGLKTGEDCAALGKKVRLD
jgi:hypothetical protein